MLEAEEPGEASGVTPVKWRGPFDGDLMVVLGNLSLDCLIFFQGTEANGGMDKCYDLSKENLETQGTSLFSGWFSGNQGHEHGSILGSQGW